MKCGWSGCDWQGKHVEFKVTLSILLYHHAGWPYQEHELSCKFVVIPCDQCDDVVTRQALDKHKDDHEQQRVSIMIMRYSLL